ncbi:MAG: hypothetical protein Q9219_002702 [cf. Caloplaca sp. 3 TL-2023]
MIKSRLPDHARKRKQTLRDEHYPSQGGVFSLSPSSLDGKACALSDGSFSDPEYDGDQSCNDPQDSDDSFNTNNKAENGNSYSLVPSLTVSKLDDDNERMVNGIKDENNRFASTHIDSDELIDDPAGNVTDIKDENYELIDDIIDVDDGNHEAISNVANVSEENDAVFALGAQRKKKRVTAKPMGHVRIDQDGLLEWFDPHKKEWRPAVYHKDIRRGLIEEAAKLGKYRKSSPFHDLQDLELTSLGFPMARGKDPDDITAFHPAYKNNGPKRDNWPKILFKYLPHQSDLLHVKPEYWQLHDGRLVIDVNNDAMYDYPELPMTLARRTNAWLLLAAMRRNSTITVQDLRGRMTGEIDYSRTDPMGRNRISMNMQRFRKFACCLTWNAIRTVDVQRDYLDAKLPRRCIRENSTETFRMLYPHEAAELDLHDAGKFLHRTRAKNRDLSQAKSQAVYEKKLADFEEQVERFERKYPNGAPNDYDAEDERYYANQAAIQEAKSCTKLDVPTDAAKLADVPTAAIKADKGLLAKQLAMIKRHANKRPKLGHSAELEERVHLLSDNENYPVLPRSRLMQQGDAVCRRRHRNYAGFLTTAPNTVADAQLLYDLLGPTRIHFESCTETKAPMTEADECYTCQWRDIQNALNVWHTEGLELNDIQVIKLIGIAYIDDEILYWNTNWVNEWFGPRPRNSDALDRKQCDGINTW